MNPDTNTPSSDTTTDDPHALAHHTQRYAGSRQSNNAYSNFILRLHLTQNPNLLRRLILQHGLLPEIIIPVYMQLEQISGHAPDVTLETAAILYSFGFDEEATARVEKVLATQPDLVPALELKASLTPDPRERRRLFDEILRIDPGNRNAIENLIILERG